jgi:leucyl-tRNA synthetase
VNDERIPIWIADYVLMGYGTGAIMAVPAHDERDFAFATKFKLPIRQVVIPSPGNPGSPSPCPLPGYRERVEELGEGVKGAFTGEGISINSDVINGLPTAEAKARITSFLHAQGVAQATVNYKLRDWLFSRQRYWGEPFPIVLDEQGNAHAVSEAELPVALPPMDDFKPTGTPEPPLAKAKDWLRYHRDGKTYTRETNTMPQWAGSCWYYLRYMDPKNAECLVDPAKEKYWLPVDLYVGGAEHAVLHLLYARFWHKVLYDLEQVSVPEPFVKLVNQGIILGETEFHVFALEDGTQVSAGDLRDIGEEAGEGGSVLVGLHRQSGAKAVGRRIGEEMVQRRDVGFALKADPSIRVDARSFKMSKSRGNVVNPDEIVRDYGADCFRLYEMYLGPLEASKPWNTRDIVGMSRFLNAVWRNLIGDDQIENQQSRIEIVPPPDALDRLTHRTIKKVGEDIAALRFNTAIAELIKLNNELTGLAAVPRQTAETLTLLLAPFAPHLAEELWQRLGHTQSLARQPWPTFDPSELVESTIELPVQVNGKIRDKLVVPADADEKTVLDLALKSERVKPWIEGKKIKTAKYVARKLVTIAVG